MQVPFLDLKAQYASIKDEISAAIQEVLDSCAFAGGPFVKKFEDDFAKYCGCKYAVGVGSGTAALWVTLLALGIGEGDEVITVPNTFIATAEAISFCGATPVFVDIDEEYYTMNPDLLEAAITKNTKAVIPVHLFGQTADMDPIMEIANKHGLHVIEDACQAHGSEYRGKRAGSMGHAGCFSFYPGKNLGAYGEAGAVVTNDEKIYKKIHMFRDHGQSQKYYHDILGWNTRMDGLQGAILQVKLGHLDEWNRRRIENAKLYNDILFDVDGIVVPQTAAYAKHVFHVYAVRVKNRSVMMNSLKEKGVSCGIHYPIPVHLQKVYRDIGLEKGSYPVSEKCAETMISLPMFSELTKQQIEHVVEGVKAGI